MENSLKEISKALGTFRDKVSSVKKGADNPFFKSKYADLPSILEVIKEPLKESGLCLYHTMKNTEGGYVVVSTIAHEETGESISSEFPVFGSKPQEIGSSISYARRYNIQAMLDIPTEDDDGNHANSAPRTTKEKTVEKKQSVSSESDICPNCGIQNEIKKGTKKDGSPWYLGKCECGTDYWVNPKFFMDKTDYSKKPDWDQ